jgi:hypothetical protein
MHITSIDQLTIVAWFREVEGEPLPLATAEALTALAPRLGPTSCLLLFRCAHRFDTGVLFETTNYPTLAAELGVGVTQIVRTIERLIRFGYARWVDDHCELLELATTIGSPTLAAVIPLGRPAPFTEPLGVA